jgi:hypothetical protein
VRESTNLSLASNVVLALSIALGGCDKFKRNDPAQPARARAEAKRQQAACGSAAVGARLKNSMFDQAIAERQGDRANLDVLADYSVARLQDPVVKGWDRSLDITRCKGRFILEVPPGAERAFGGERRLQAEIDYTAQASADGAGFVYQQHGAEPIVARLAAFNLASGAYRPPPAIDEPQATTGIAARPTLAQAEASLQTRASPSQPAAPAGRPRPAEVTPPPKPAPGTRLAERTRTEPTAAASRPSGSGEATVRAFYGALGSGNGAAASSQVIPEKRSSGAYSSGAMSRFYGRLAEPIRLTGIVPLASGAYRVKYHYSAGRSRCNGTAVVRLTKRGERDLIQSIQALNGC